MRGNVAVVLSLAVGMVLAPGVGRAGSERDGRPPVSAGRGRRGRSVFTVGSTIAIGVLALYLALLGRGLITSLVATTVVILILFISVDLDRPHRGLIRVPDSALVTARAAMNPPPAATGP